MNVIQRAALPIGIGIVGIIAALLFIFSLPAHASAHENMGIGPHSVGSSLEVSLGDNGNALVRGAKVTSVSGSNITAQTVFGSTVLTWTVTTDSSTNITPKSGSTTISDIATGDYISFSGTLDTTTSGLTVHAKAVKDFSKVASNTRTSFNGTVSSVNTSGKTFVLSTNTNGSVNVALASTTQIFSGADTFLFANLVAGDNVNVKGIYTASNNTVLADSVSVNRTVNKGDSDEHGIGAFFNAFKNKFGFHFGSKSKSE